MTTIASPPEVNERSDREVDEARLLRRNLLSQTLNALEDASAALAEAQSKVSIAVGHALAYDDADLIRIIDAANVRVGQLQDTTELGMRWARSHRERLDLTR